MRKRRTVIITLVALSIIGYLDSLYLPVRLPFGFDVALTAVVFYGFGYILKDRIMILNPDMSIVVLLVALGMTLGLVNGRVDMNYNQYGSYPLFYASAFSSIIAYVCIAKYVGNFKPIVYIGKNSLIFFILENTASLTVSLLAYVIFSFRLSSLPLSLTHGIGVAVVTILLLFPASYIINSYFPFMLGKVDLLYIRQRH